MATNRNPIFDIMKGIGIILMLVGHVPPGDGLYHFIYSFHMPLFFIVAGYFANTIQEKRDLWRFMKKDATRLLLPTIVTMLGVILLSPLHYFTDGNFDYVISQALSMIWAGDVLSTPWGTISSPMWFLIALFWVRVFFRLIEWCWRKCNLRYDELLILSCIALSYGAIQLHSFLLPTPWCILKGISALSFYSIGWYLRKHQLPWYIYSLFVVVWILALQFGGIDMYYYQYQCFPLDVLGAVGATWLIYQCSKGVLKLNLISKVLQWFGVNSLIIFCMTCFDRRTYFVRMLKHIIDWNLVGLESVIFHYVIQLALVTLIIYIPYLKKIYGGRTINEI